MYKARDRICHRALEGALGCNYHIKPMRQRICLRLRPRTGSILSFGSRRNISETGRKVKPIIQSTAGWQDLLPSSYVLTRGYHRPTKHPSPARKRPQTTFPNPQNPPSITTPTPLLPTPSQSETLSAPSPLHPQPPA